MHARHKPKLNPNRKTYTHKHAHRLIPFTYTKRTKEKELSFNTVRKLSVDLVAVDEHDYEMENFHH
jgi:hypothetical protein